MAIGIPPGRNEHAAVGKMMQVGASHNPLSLHKEMGVGLLLLLSLDSHLGVR